MKTSMRHCGTGRYVEPSNAAEAVHGVERVLSWKDAIETYRDI
jgi:hypothetical protein